MSQQEIMDLLKADPTKWWTVEELSARLAIQRMSIRCNVSKMIKYDEVEHKRVKDKMGRLYALAIRYKAI